MAFSHRSRMSSSGSAGQMVRYSGVPSGSSRESRMYMRRGDFKDVVDVPFGRADAAGAHQYERRNCCGHMVASSAASQPPREKPIRSAPSRPSLSSAPRYQMAMSCIFMDQSSWSDWPKPGCDGMCRVWFWARASW